MLAGDTAVEHSDPLLRLPRCPPGRDVTAALHDARTLSNFLCTCLYCTPPPENRKTLRTLRNTYKIHDEVPGGQKNGETTMLC